MFVIRQNEMRWKKRTGVRKSANSIKGNNHLCTFTIESVLGTRGYCSRWLPLRKTLGGSARLIWARRRQNTGHYGDLLKSLQFVKALVKVMLQNMSDLKVWCFKLWPGRVVRAWVAPLLAEEINQAIMWSKWESGDQRWSSCCEERLIQMISWVGIASWLGHIQLGC